MIFFAKHFQYSLTIDNNDYDNDDSYSDDSNNVVFEIIFSEWQSLVQGLMS